MNVGILEEGIQIRCLDADFRWFFAATGLLKDHPHHTRREKSPAFIKRKNFVTQ